MLLVVGDRPAGAGALPAGDTVSFWDALLGKAGGFAAGRPHPREAAIADPRLRCRRYHYMGCWFSMSINPFVYAYDANGRGCCRRCLRITWEFAFSLVGLDGIPSNVVD